METNHNQPQSLDEMVFENRNKAYGAYQLRKLYPKHLTQASFYAVGLFVLLFTFPALVTEVTGGAEKAIPIAKPIVCTLTKVELVDISTPKQPILPEASATPPPAEPTIKNVIPRVVDNASAIEENIPTQDQLQAAASGYNTSQGTGDPVESLPEETEGTGNAPVGVPVGAPEVFFSVEQMPEFEGGMSALMTFVGKNLRYPPAAQKSAVEGTVVLSFVVSPTGEIADIQVIKGLGYGTEEEVVRVLKKMPRWKPGMQNGTAVPVRFTLPIRLEMRQ